MNIDKFAKRPELVKITIDNKDIIDVYQEPIVFYIYDSIDINTYFDYFKSQTENDGQNLNRLLRTLIRNEKGEICIQDDYILPVDLAIASITTINEYLGKSKTRSLT